MSDAGAILGTIFGGTLGGIVGGTSGNTPSGFHKDGQWWTNQKTGESKYGPNPPDGSGAWTPGNGPASPSGGSPAGNAGPTTQMFGNTPQNINNGLVTPTSAGQTAGALNTIMGRQAPQMQGADFSAMGKTQASQMGVLNQLKGYAQGLGPSAAQVGTTIGMGQAAGMGRGVLGGGNALASRGGLLGSQASMGNAVNAGAAARTNEQQQMMSAYGGGAKGLAGTDLNASALADLQIQQQQALGLGQNQRNYALGQGTLGTAMQEQVDQQKFAQQQAAIVNQRSNDAYNNSIKLSASAAAAAGAA